MERMLAEPSSAGLSDRSLGPRLRRDDGFTVTMKKNEWNGTTSFTVARPVGSPDQVAFPSATSTPDRRIHATFRRARPELPALLLTLSG
jgi:hypothetical protein